VYNDNATPSIRKCIFSHNDAYVYQGSGSGGGIYNKFSSTLIDSCTFYENNSNIGGGVFNDYRSAAYVSNCTFTANRSSFIGGGMYNEDVFSSQTNIYIVTICNCNFSFNVSGSRGGGICDGNYRTTFIDKSTFFTDSSYNGGGIYSSSSALSISECNFSGNKAAYHGGGIYTQSVALSIGKSIFSANTSFSGAGIYNAATAAAITNCTFFANNCGMSEVVYIITILLHLQSPIVSLFLITVHRMVQQLLTQTLHPQLRIAPSFLIAVAIRQVSFLAIILALL
jgi:predicted outer membrane repeat protein